jgi:hypothetical protein
VVNVYEVEMPNKAISDREAEELDWFLRSVVKLQGKLKRFVRPTDVFKLLIDNGYRRLDRDQVKAYDAGRLATAHFPTT